MMVDSILLNGSTIPLAHSSSLPEIDATMAEDTASKDVLQGLYQCLTCESLIINGKMYKIEDVAMPGTGAKAFPQKITEKNPKGSLCQVCYQDLVSRTLYVSPSNKRLWPSTPQQEALFKSWSAGLLPSGATMNDVLVSKQKTTLPVANTSVSSDSTKDDKKLKNPVSNPLDQRSFTDAMPCMKCLKLFYVDNPPQMVFIKLTAHCMVPVCNKCYLEIKHTGTNVTSHLHSILDPGIIAQSKMTAIDNFKTEPVAPSKMTAIDNNFKAEPVVQPRMTAINKNFLTEPVAQSKMTAIDNNFKAEPVAQPKMTAVDNNLLKSEPVPLFLKVPFADTPVENVPMLVQEPSVPLKISNAPVKTADKAESTSKSRRALHRVNILRRTDRKRSAEGTLLKSATSAGSVSSHTVESSGVNRLVPDLNVLHQDHDYLGSVVSSPEQNKAGNNCLWNQKVTQEVPSLSKASHVKTCGHGEGGTEKKQKTLKKVKTKSPDIFQSKKPHVPLTAPAMEVESQAGPRIVPAEVPPDAKQTAEISQCDKAVQTDDLPAEETKPRKHTTKQRVTQQRIINYIKHSHYQSAFSLLAMSKKKAQKVFVRTAQNLLKQELRTLHQGNVIESLIGPVTMAKLKDFDWSKVWEEMKTKLPLFSGIIESMMHRKTQSGRQKDFARQGFLSCVVLYHVKQQQNLLQSIFSLLLSIHKVSPTILEILEFLGISCGTLLFKWRNNRKSTLKVVDEMAKSVLKEKVDNEEMMEASYLVKPYTSGCPEPLNMCTSYSLCVGDLEKMNQEGNVPDLPDLMAFPFAITNRFGTSGARPRQKPAQKLPISTFLPSRMNLRDLRFHMAEKVKGILIEHLTCLHQFRPYTSNAVFQQKAMEEKSEVIAMPAMQFDGQKSAGEHIHGILHELQKLVPTVHDQSMSTLLHTTCGLQEPLAHVRACNSVTLDGCKQDLLVQVGPEFGKEAQLLQDMVNRFCDYEVEAAPSEHSHGSLHDMKELFLSHSISEVRTNYSATFNFIKFTTEGLVLLLALKFANIKNLNSNPPRLPDDKEDALFWVDTLANRIVDRVWTQPSEEELFQISSAYNNSDAPFTEKRAGCCNRILSEEEEPMVRCYNSDCSKVWVHYSCAKPPLMREPEGDWYCCKSCEDERAGYIYCHCKKKVYNDDMIQCHLKGACHWAEWYHLSCLGVEDTDNFPEQWYCSEECSLDEQDDDAVLEYSLSLLWSGLNLLVRRDVLRQGNGPLMLTMWKMDLLHFWQQDNSKFIKIAHELLAYTGGFLPKAVSRTLLWNRVANLKGGENGNVPLDRIIETRSRKTKELLRNFKGRLNYVAKLGSALPELLNRMQTVLKALETEISDECLMLVEDEQVDPKQYRKDLRTFLSEYESDGLFDYFPPRSHKGFENFKHREPLRDPTNLAHTLGELNLQMDNLKEKTNNAKLKVAENLRRDMVARVRLEAERARAVENLDREHKSSVEAMDGQHTQEQPDADPPEPAAEMSVVTENVTATNHWQNVIDEDTDLAMEVESHGSP